MVGKEEDLFVFSAPFAAAAADDDDEPDWTVDLGGSSFLSFSRYNLAR